MAIAKVEERILRDTLKCSFCGMCEWVCPTLKIMDNHRLYGPRGRVNSIVFLIKNGIWSMKGTDSIFTCLLCGACSTQCPAGVDLKEDIRMFRYYLLANKKV
jgi:glycolate oxidase iron-sulfur subunit